MSHKRHPHGLAVSRLLTRMSNSIYRGALRAGLGRHLHRSRGFTRPTIRLRRGSEGLHGLRIAFVSDIHAGCFMSEHDLVRFFESVAAQEADMVCLGGDLIDFNAHEALLLRKGLSLLSPPLGVFAVPGNHEYHADPGLSVWRAVLQELGVHILINQGRRVQRDGASLWIAGVDDLHEGRPDASRALEGRAPDEPVVLLSHHPDFFNEVGEHDVDLMLSGHTHGGQILILGRRPPTGHTKHGYWTGRFESGNAQLYVGRGAGHGFIPVRIGAPAEVPILELRLRD